MRGLCLFSPGRSFRAISLARCCGWASVEEGGSDITKTRASDSHGPGEIAYGDGPSSWLVRIDMLGKARILPSEALI